MRNPSVAFAQALTDAPRLGIVPRRLIYITARNRSNPALTQGYGFWTGDENLDFAVKDGQTGLATVRSYYGIGTSLIIPTVPRLSQLQVINLECKLPITNPIVEDMVRNYSVRFAKVDIHEVMLSTTSRLTAVAEPEITFLGESDTDPIETAAAGGVSTVTLKLVSDAIRSLTRTSPKLRSYQAQYQGRSNDQFGKFGNAFEQTKIPWGET